MKHACPDCGHRQDTRDRCAKCGWDGLFDLDNEAHVLQLREIDQRARDKRNDRVRMASVAFGMILVFALWLVPGFWHARKQYFAIPLLIDQWALMIGIALGLSKLLEKTAPRGKFYYLDDDA